MSIFKDTFRPNIRAQLNARQTALINRSRNTIQYLNSRNAWVRMSSSVNVLGRNDLAASNILFGGNGVNAKGKTTNSAYSHTDSLGFRPKPGITSIDVQSAGAYGSLRKVTVNFQAWDLDQLNDLEKLYMRPGYTALVEWGWSPYLEANNNLNSNVRFYDIINSPPGSQSQIYTDLFRRIENSGGNYDAAFGKVQNYSWKARSDGGYDCSTTIVTIGEVLESIKINYTPTLAATYEQNGMMTAGGGIASFLSESYTRNIMVGICKELKGRANLNPNFGFIDITDATYGTPYYLYKAELNIVGGSPPPPPGNTEVYVALSSLVGIMNNWVRLADQNTNSYVEISVNSSNLTSDGTPLLCLADPLQVSTDPTVCLIPNQNYMDPPNLLSLPNIPPENFMGCFARDAGAHTPNLQYLDANGFGIIGNIFVNLDYIVSLTTDQNLGNQDKKEKQEISMYNFFKSLMAGINNAIGNLANFDIHVEPYDGNIGRIIDLHYVNSNKGGAFSNAFNFELRKADKSESNLLGASIVRNYSLESKIFSEQSTIVAIASQVQSTGALGTENNTLVNYNDGITDRIIQELEAVTDGGLDNAAKLAAAIANADIITKFILGLGTKNCGGGITGNLPLWRVVYGLTGVYDVAESYKYANALRDIINYRRSLQATDTNLDRAIIPTTLTLDIDGIGGIVIGNMFTIPARYLPRVYRGTGRRRIGYLVTRLGHNISNGDWITRIEAQFTIID